jgi:carbon-monoxide dehydrogenase large subunit
MPHATPTGCVYDSGAFEQTMEQCLALAGWNGFDARREASAARGLLRGRGMSYFIEQAAVFNERMELRFDPGGSLTIVAGTFSHGQGHATTYAQMACHWLGVPFESIRLLQGDTAQVAIGRGTFAARSSLLGGCALKMAADRLLEKAKPMAAKLLEAAAADLEFIDGTFRVAGTDRSIRLVEVARAFYRPIGLERGFDLGLEASGSWSADPPSFPNGCHACEVEIDPETGEVRIERYAAVDDVGTVINPMVCEGQIQGGIAQGVGQALLEQVVYERESGQLLSGSFADYAMPRAADFPSFNLAFNEGSPSTTNPIGIKGAGESGAVGAPAAVINAVLDALRPLGVEHIDMPATPERVWRAIREARSH